MPKIYDPCYYPEYLCLDKILGAQKPLSAKHGEEAHDETLFIIVHQVYELWFKQILHEIDSIVDIFSNEQVKEGDLGACLSKLYRINSIQRVLQEQFNILETMPPENFLDFRDFIVPASGFQSTQFREIEIKLGLKSDKRLKYDNQSVFTRLSKEDRERMEGIEKAPNLQDYLNTWLERIPFLQESQFDFWSEYLKAVNKMLTSDEKIINSHPDLSDAEKKSQMNQLNMTRNSFETLFNEKEYNLLKDKGDRTLSHKAMLSALFIRLYRHYPVLNLPARFIMALVDLDEHITTWRYRHSLLAHRMLGTKIGTGGSAGHKYLAKTTQVNRLFTDLYDLSTFLIPKSLLPKIPKHIEEKMHFHYEINPS